MFSSRTDWNTTPNRLSGLAAEKHLRGESIIDLTESNPTKCEFSYPSEEIRSALTEPSIVSYRPEPRGLLSARKAIAEYYAVHGIAITPEQIILTSSTSEAYSFLFKLLCNVGDEVVVPQPSYPLFEYLCQLNDITLRYYRLAYDGEWHIDFASLRAQFSDRTRAIVLVHPNNPTGSYLKQNEFDQICSLASEHHFSLIADEVFGSYDISSDVHCANILTSQSFVPLFSLNGISKLLGLPQLKLSWIVVDGNLQQRDEALNRLDIIADTFLSVNTPVQVALPKLLRSSSDIRNQIRLRIQTNYRLLQKVFADSSTSVLRVEGGWYAVLQLPQKYSDDNWAEEILTHQNILVQPGHFFDMEQKSCIVISLLSVSDLFDDAILRLQRFIEEK
ncbi:MAG: pyridoxal phosphate-dependent aminotransferase [Bacteroidota bacterium]